MLRVWGYLSFPHTRFKILMTNIEKLYQDFVSRFSFTERMIAYVDAYLWIRRPARFTFTGENPAKYLEKIKITRADT